MYAEIKTNNKILVNRLNPDEGILLKNISDLANEANSKITISPLTDDTGDFGGIFINVEKTSGLAIKLENTLPDTVAIPTGSTLDIIFDTNVPNDDVKILTNISNPDIKLSTSANVLSINAANVTSGKAATLNYSIIADGFTSLEGVLYITTIAKDTVQTYINCYEVEANSTQRTEIDDFTAVLKDDKDTEILASTKDSTFYKYNLPVGLYSVEITKTGFNTKTQSIEITKDMTLVPNNTTIAIELTKTV